jgi:hypothetical protein
LAEESNKIEKARLKALKDDIENMQVRAVETARSNSKSESPICLIEAITGFPQTNSSLTDLQNKQLSLPE